MKVLYKYDDTCGLVCLLGTPSITVCRTIGRPFFYVGEKRCEPYCSGSCLLIQPWVEWAIIPLLMVTLFMDGRAIIKRFRVLHPWRIKRQEYLRLRNWVLINSGEARGRV